MMARMDDRRARLGSLIRQRRLELRLSEREAVKLAAIARNTWSGAEKGRTRTAEHNWPGIEQALRWAPGSIEAILAGGEPTIEESQRPPSRVPTGDELADEIERIRHLPISAAARRRMIETIVSLFEEAAAETEESDSQARTA